MVVVHGMELCYRKKEIWRMSTQTLGLHLFSGLCAYRLVQCLSRSRFQCVKKLGENLNSFFICYMTI